MSHMPVPVSEPIESIDNNTLTNFNTTIVNLGVNTTAHLDIVTNNVGTEANSEGVSSSKKFCKGRRKYWELALFVDVNQGEFFKRCCRCRQRDYNRHHPQAQLAQQVAEPIANNKSLLFVL